MDLGVQLSYGGLKKHIVFWWIRIIIIAVTNNFFLPHMPVFFSGNNSV